MEELRRGTLWKQPIQINSPGQTMTGASEPLSEVDGKTLPVLCRRLARIILGSGGIKKSSGHWEQNRKRAFSLVVYTTKISKRRTSPLGLEDCSRGERKMGGD